MASDLLQHFPNDKQESVIRVAKSGFIMPPGGGALPANGK